MSKDRTIIDNRNNPLAGAKYNFVMMAHEWDCDCLDCEQTRAAGLEYVGDYDEEE